MKLPKSKEKVAKLSERGGFFLFLLASEMSDSGCGGGSSGQFFRSVRMKRADDENDSGVLGHKRIVSHVYGAKGQATDLPAAPEDGLVKGDSVSAAPPKSADVRAKAQGSEEFCLVALF